MHSAAVIIIGNEILSGKFVDENGPYLIRRLRELGVPLRRLVVVPDETALIVDEVRRCAASHEVVITTGGVGPTHDDITMPAMAEAFGVPLVEHVGLVEMWRQRHGSEPNEAALRMARLPEGVELFWTNALRFPVVRLKNVYILPGVPSLMKAKFEFIAERLRGEPLHVARVVTDEDEVFIAERLEAAVAQWPEVEIGSYPRFDEGPHHVIIAMESRNPDSLELCRAFLASCLRPFLPRS